MEYRKTTFFEVAQDVEALEKYLGDAKVGAKLQPEAALPNVMNAVQQIAKDERSKTTGEFLTRILRLRPKLSAGCLEYINQAVGYVGTNFRLLTKVKNISTHAIRIHTATATVPNPRYPLEPMSIPSYTAIQPGQEVELESTIAVNALVKHGKYCKRLLSWDQTGVHEPSGALVETGYKIKLTTQVPGTFEAKEEVIESAVPRKKKSTK